MNDENETKGKPEGLTKEETETIQRKVVERVMAPLENKVRVAIVLDITERGDDGVNIAGSSCVLFDDEAATPILIVSGKSLVRAFQMVARGFLGPSKEELIGEAMAKSGEAILKAIKDIEKLGETRAKNDEATKTAETTDADEAAEEVTK